MRLIDADDINYVQAIDATDDLDYVRRYSIDRMPTIDAAPVKHGEWIRKSPTAWMWTCSCCKKDDAYAYSAGESFEPDVLQDLFCPNCGAKMDGGKDDGT